MNNPAINQYIRAANYLSVAQIFLQDNFLLERPLTHDDIKPRLLGHWGSCPGVNFTYAHLNLLAKQYDQEVMFVLGPGHAFPALQANLFLEGSLQEFYPEATQSYAGIEYLCRNFSWPYGFPSHSNPGTPGVILEGGELGYSLATAYGAALDNPELLVACLIGDGEAETGALSAAWHINHIVNPRMHGTVLPIVHINGYKISGPTVFGRLPNEQLQHMFKGFGFEPLLVDESEGDPHQAMQRAFVAAHSLLSDVRSGKSAKPPMILLRTPKGWSGVKELNGNKVEGNSLSHQVVLTEAKANSTQLQKLQDWLASYRINELFDQQKGFGDFLRNALPPHNKRIGSNRRALGGAPHYKPLNLPSAVQFSEDATTPGTIGSSSMRRAGLYLKEVFKRNKETQNFRLFSPDETYSNKLDAVFEETSRSWMLPIKEWDKDLSVDGRVMELLSEHSLQGLMQGYILTGRHGVFASYEAFIHVITSMMDQYAKFLHQSQDIEWRDTIPSFNYILTSSGWRQEHNGFSHQNPGFINDALQRQGDFVNVYFPADGNTTLAVLEHCLSTTRQINVVVAGKTLEPRWLTPDKAQAAVKHGVSIWDFASDDNPDVVLVAAGDYLTKECLAAISYLKKDCPSIKIRFVNILSLTSCGLGRGGTCLIPEEFNRIFTPDKPVIVSFHGYPETIKSILFDYIQTSPRRFSIHGYIEEGSTTTPFDMHVRNKASRFDLAIEVLERISSSQVINYEEARHVIAKYKNRLRQNTEYIKQHGVDMAEIEEWQWPGSNN